MNDERLFDLNDISIATPCNADWDAMDGDERKRFCGACQKHVYNITAMKEAEAYDFIAAELEANAKLPCLRFFRRADGTILFQDCPVGLKTIKRAIKWISKIAASALVFLLSPGVAKGKDGFVVEEEFDYSSSIKINVERTPQGTTRSDRYRGLYNGVPDPGTLAVRNASKKKVLVPSECDTNPSSSIAATEDWSFKSRLDAPRTVKANTRMQVQEGTGFQGMGTGPFPSQTDKGETESVRVILKPWGLFTFESK